MNDVETSVMTLTVSDDAHAAHVTATSSHSNGTCVKVDEILDFASRQFNLDGVVDFDSGVWVADTSSSRQF